MGSKDDRPKCIGPPLAALEEAEREAIGKLIARQEPELRGYFRNQGVTEPELDDAVAATWAKVWSGGNIDVQTMHDRKKVRSVVFMAARFVVGQLFKQRKNEDRYADLEEEEEAGAADDPLAAAQFSDMNDAFERAKAALSERQREVYVLKRAGYSYDEIGERLRLSPETAKTYNERAKLSIAAQMEEAGYHDVVQENDQEEKEQDPPPTDSSESEK